MAGTLNKVFLIGNVGKDPDIRSTQDGRKIANFSMATSESWKDKNSGERKEITEWSRISVFGPLAEIVEKYVRKGSKVCVIGKLATRKWTDSAGVEKYSTEVVLDQFRGELTLLDKRAAEEAAPAPQSGGAGPDDSDIPF